MTFAIVAWDQRSGTLGVAAASSTVAELRSSLPCRPGVGVIASLGTRDPDLALASLGDLDAGMDPRDALRRRLESDPQRNQRQLLVVDARGRTAAHSGRYCSPSFGHTEGTDHAAGGNRLVSPNVVGAMSLSFERSGGDPLGERLLLALESGARVGGVGAGRGRAILLVYGAEAEPLVDLEVEDHADPVRELRRIR